MIGGYVKTAGRIILRNRLFSFINIVGLAISMSVGLMMIEYSIWLSEEISAKKLLCMIRIFKKKHYHINILILISLKQAN